MNLAKFCIRHCTKVCDFKFKQKRSRALTESEKALAYSVFGDALDLRAVKLKTAWWVLKGYAVSPNGNVYFNAQDWVSDFSKAPLSKQSWLIHELTHVWQLQQGLKVVSRALFDRRYDYTFKTGKAFLEYGIEQQARMVQDYFMRRECGEACDAWQDCIPFLAQDTSAKPDQNTTAKSNFENQHS